MTTKTAEMKKVTTTGRDAEWFKVALPCGHESETFLFWKGNKSTVAECRVCAKQFNVSR